MRFSTVRGLEFVQGGFGAVDQGFVVDEGRDEFEEVGLAFEEVGEEIVILRGQGAELVEGGCLTSSSWLSAKRGSRYMNISRRHEPGATGHTERSCSAVPRRMLEIQSGAPEIYRRKRRPALLLARLLIN